MSVIKGVYNHLNNTGILRILPDKIFLKISYRVITGNHLNLNNPQTFNEKLQWLKLYNRRPEYSMMVDKFEVKKWVSEQIGADYIIPTLGVWKHFDEIDFDCLPQQFVLKCTHDSGGVVICKNKKDFDFTTARNTIETSLRSNFFYRGREYPYKNVPPRIIAEKYIETQLGDTLRDYKFFCFNGIVKCLYVSESSHSEKQKCQFFDRDYVPMDCKRSDYNAYSTLPEKPEDFDEMIQKAEKLSSGIPHVRVDFYDINHHVYFGEMTFFTNSGFVPFEDVRWDQKLGAWIDIPMRATL